jgi:hypothetical protein
VLTLALATVYGATLLPGVGYSGDTAKFQFVGWVLGTPHSTGYPTYLVLLHLFQTLVPLGSLAFRANVLSAVFSIVAAWFCLGLLLRLGLSRVTALAATLTAFLAPTLWSQAIVAEVYALHSLFVLATLFFLVRWHGTRSRGDLLAACAVYAFSFGNHMTAIALLPAFVAFVALCDRRVFTDWGLAARVLALVGLGALQYGYLVWRSLDPDTPYLESQAPDLLDLWYIVTGKGFASHLFAFTPRQMLLERVPVFARLLVREIGFALPVAILGVFALGDRALRTLLVLALLGPLAFALDHKIPDIEPYFIPVFTVVALFFGIGAWRIEAWLGARAPRLRHAGVLAWVVPLLSVTQNWSRVDRSGDVADARMAEWILASAGEDAVILSSNYRMSQFLWYYLIGEGQEAERHLYLVHQVRPREVRAYLREGVAIPLPEEQRRVPPGLTVFTVGEAWARPLERQHLRVSPATPPLSRVE